MRQFLKFPRLSLLLGVPLWLWCCVVVWLCFAFSAVLLLESAGSHARRIKIGPMEVMFVGLRRAGNDLLEVDFPGGFVSVLVRLARILPGQSLI